MIAEFMTFRQIDRLQIVLFILYALYIIICLLITSIPKAERALIALTAKLQELTDALNDNEPYDPEWMDPKKYRETKL